MSSEHLTRDNLHLSRPRKDCLAGPSGSAINCNHPLPEAVIGYVTDSWNVVDVANVGLSTPSKFSASPLARVIR
jgi:hypothetical protein